MKKKIVDAHSHIGKDNNFEIEGCLYKYLDLSKASGVTDSLIMPVPCPQFISPNKEISIPFFWRYENKKFQYYSKFVDKIKENPKNPYKEINKLYFNIIKKVNTDINLYFVPLVHPILDSFDYLKSLISHKPTAIKLHGVASGFSPEEISPSFWKFIENYNVPLIIHTDYDKNNIQFPLNQLRNSNQPYLWLKVLKRYNLRALITHGARLDKRSIDIINNNDQFIIGIGPDLRISQEKNRLYLEKEDYLKNLLKMISKNKVVLDFDYPWNWNGTEFDFNSISRIKQLVINKKDLEKIIGATAVKFFNI